MPNHVRNVLEFKHLQPDEINFLVNAITTVDFSTPDDITARHIDFDLIIPEPKTKDECPADCIVHKDSHIMEDKDRPWFDWYRWHLNNWGTKWNAYDSYVEVGKTWVRFVFSTAWSMPYPVYKQLTLLGFDFEVRYADEDYGSNCGKLIYCPDKTGFTDLVHYDESEVSKDPTVWARHLWDTY